MAQEGTIFDIQHFCTHDGPGIRTTVFFKGCPLRCAWCHNPESQSSLPELLFHIAKCAGCGECERACPHHAAHETLMNSQLRSERCKDCTLCADSCVYGAIEKAGKAVSAGEVMEEVLKDLSYYENSGGGMTLSGGEPLAQPKFALELLDKARKNGIHTAVETSGQGRAEDILAMAEFVDLWLWDIKALDAEILKAYTGANLGLILGNLKKLSDLGANIRLRILFIPELHDREEYISSLAALLKSLNKKTEFEIIPYHKLGLSKREKLGLSDKEGYFDEPKPSDASSFENRLRLLL